MSRNTSTGRVLEEMIPPSLKRGGYSFERNKKVGERLNGDSHKADYFLTKEEILISLKWQQKGGTAEQKIPYEVLCLGKAILDGKAKKAYLILGGQDKRDKQEGWTHRTFYTSGELENYLHPNYTRLVKIMMPEEFIVLANEHKL